MSKERTFASVAEKRRYEMSCPKKTNDSAMLSDAVGELLCERLARVLRQAFQLREASWERKDPYGSYYRVTASEAAEQACVDIAPRLAPIVACLLTADYCDTWDWCDQILGPEI